MNKLKKILVLLMIATIVSFSLTGCKDSSEHPEGAEHPKSAEHPEGAEHPKGAEHPAAPNE